MWGVKEKGEQHEKQIGSFMYKIVCVLWVWDIQIYISIYVSSIIYLSSFYFSSIYQSSIISLSIYLSSIYQGIYLSSNYLSIYLSQYGGGRTAPWWSIRVGIVWTIKDQRRPWEGKSLDPLKSHRGHGTFQGRWNGLFVYLFVYILYQRKVWL
jgi:hypothetical protein